MKDAVKKAPTLPTLLIMSTAYIAVFSSVQGFKAMLPLIRDDFGISGAQAGLYSTFFYASGVALAIFSGRIVDGIGPRKGLIGGVLAIAILMLLHTLSPYFFVLLLLALVTGVGFSIVTPSINKGIIELVDPNKRAVSNGIVHAGGGLGGILGSSLLPLIGEHYSWRVSLLASASIAFVMAVVLTKLFHPVNNNGEVESTEEKRSFKADFKSVLGNRLVILVCVMGLVLGLSLGNMTIHYTLFLTGDLGFTPSVAGVSLSLFMLGGILGNPTIGFLNDRFFNSNRRYGLTIIGLMISSMFFIMAFFIFPAQPPIGVVMVITFVFGLFAFAVLGMVFTTLGDVVGAKLMGTATGLLLVFMRSSMVFGPPVLGHFADVTGNYQLSWTLVAIVVLAFSLFFFVKTHKYRHLLRRGGFNG